MNNDYIDLTRNIVDIVKDPQLHALHFEYNGFYYCFSGWWGLAVTKRDPLKGINTEVAFYMYDSKEDFLRDKVFNGKTLAEIADKVTNIDAECEVS